MRFNARGRVESIDYSRARERGATEGSYAATGRRRHYCVRGNAGGSQAAGGQKLGASISGVVNDATGAVMLAVTVEAASAALIEQGRTVVTDSAGRYSIVNLRPGTYTVTFSLIGISTVQREGIVLEGTFTAQDRRGQGFRTWEPFTNRSGWAAWAVRCVW